MVASPRFGRTIRKLREARRFGLNAFAQAAGMSPTYLSKVERGLLQPPAEGKILAIAKLLDQDGDVLLALAGRVASDLPRIIREHPKELAALLRATATWPEDEFLKLSDWARERGSTMKQPHVHMTISKGKS
jgi:HTH-type transcriptional regulator, competence development regulator